MNELYTHLSELLGDYNYLPPLKLTIIYFCCVSRRLCICCGVWLRCVFIHL